MPRTDKTLVYAELQHFMPNTLAKLFMLSVLFVSTVVGKKIVE